MIHEIAKLRLEQAGTFRDRVAAVRSAIEAGMPLSQIEEHLDLIDANHPRRECVGCSSLARGRNRFTFVPAR